VQPPFAWSVSRHDSFDTCRRKYFYSYYGSNEDPEIKRLKRLSALPLWAGNVVHETIETMLKTHETMPSETEQEAIIRAAVHSQMLGDWRDSESGSLRFRLFEHEYAVTVEPEDKKIVVGIVMRSLRNLFRSDILREAFAAGKDRWLTVEDRIEYMVGDVPVALRMDLAFRDAQGRVVIVDWKTGRSEGRFNAIQLAGYALYAAQQGWAQSPGEIQTELAYLVLPKYVRRAVDQPTLDQARAFVTQSAGRMRGLLTDVAANEARLEDFPMVDRPRVCKRCNFRRLCFPRVESQPAMEMPLAALTPRAADSPPPAP
jgi:CRISPR/Cas system-associated exonuclease Cas4 (RecB family)